MTKRKSAYTLRYGESQQNDMLVYFDDEETLVENLSRIIPSAIARGFLPAECSADNVKLVYENRPLNLNVSMGRQEVTVAKRAILTIQDMSSTVRIKINYTPDNHAERSDTVYVSPNKILGAELSKFFKGITKDYKFFKRTPKKFNLIRESKKVNLNKSLAAQGIESGFDAVLAPRLIFRWPPGKFAIASVSVIFVLALGLVGYMVYDKYLRPIPRVERFYVTFTVDAESQLITSDTTLVMSPNSPQTLVLGPGVHQFEVMPKDYPIFQDLIELISEGATRDSVAKAIAIPERFAGATPLPVVINGYSGRSGVESPENKIMRGLSINGHPQQLDEFGVGRVELYRGLYEIKYDLDEERLDVDNMKYDPTVLRPSRVRFDFSKFKGDATFVTFHYLPSN